MERVSTEFAGSVDANFTFDRGEARTPPNQGDRFVISATHSERSTDVRHAPLSSRLVLDRSLSLP